jgi:class 3 adenylate cyclase
MSALASYAWDIPAVEEDRVLATLLFTDIVGSTERAAALGDRRWRELIERHHAAVRSELALARGREIDTAGDGFFASFDSPARAIRCGRAILKATGELGLDVRVGVHAGECELIDGKPAGIAVHTGARVVEHAAPGELLVSSTVKDLVAGSGLEFEDRGLQELCGVPGDWRLYAAG